MAFRGIMPDDDPNHPLRKPKIFIGSGMRPLQARKSPQPEPDQQQTEEPNEGEAKKSN